MRRQPSQAPYAGTMKYAVLITDAASRDLEEIYDWIAEHDSAEKADYVLDRLHTNRPEHRGTPLSRLPAPELPPGMHASTARSFSNLIESFIEVMAVPMLSST